MVRASSRAHGLHLDLDLDIVADEDSTGLERGIPRQAEIASVDLRLSAEAHALAAPRITAPPLERRIQHDFARHVANGEVADDAEARARLRLPALDAAAPEAHR